MLALVALICFVLRLFEVELGEVDLVVLGLAFVAAHLVWIDGQLWKLRRPR